ncbi:MAG: hypothetical protein L6V93_03640 [Clostridiales bacterium]|nr:MAG: hypothetical protein L6V93_03640 [Clostridiales bacterium]
MGEKNERLHKQGNRKICRTFEKQLERAEKLNQNEDFTDFTALDKIVIGIIPGDGIGPIILREAEKYS